MISLKYIPACYLCLMVFMPGAQAQFNDDSRLKLGGYIYIDNRVRTEDGAWSWNENRLDLELKKNFNNKGAFYSDIWLRSFGFPFLNSADQLFNPDDVSPYNLEIREAYIDIYDFLLKGLDLRVGRQRIAWGTGDRINPTDNLNSDDLEDIWDFGRHLGSDGFRFDYFLSDYHIEAVYIPFFTPALLPRGDWSDAFMPVTDLPPMVQLGTISDSLATPEYRIGESSSYGLKFSGFLLGYDFSVSYVYNRDDFPVQYYNSISFNPPNIIDIRSDLYYHRQHVFGADMSGAIGSVGIWGELGVFLPEKEVVMTTDLSALGMPPRDSVILKKQAYAKYVAGLDYTFGDGSYLNFQYFHGFVTERGQGNLNDYFMIAWEKNLFNDKLKIIPLAGAFIVAAWDNIPDNHAWIYSPAITYYPNINTEINLGCRIIGGDGDNTFALVKDYDEVFLSLKFNF